MATKHKMINITAKVFCFPVKFVNIFFFFLDYKTIIFFFKKKSVFVFFWCCLVYGGTWWHLFFTTIPCFSIVTSGRPVASDDLRKIIAYGVSNRDTVRVDKCS